MVKAYEYHELANILPLMEGEEYESFKASIAASELIEPVVLHEGKILDGRNRYRAGRELNVSVPFRKWEGEYGSPKAFVKAVNFDRRHLTTSQKALVAERLRRATVPDGGAQICAREDLAESFGVSERSIDMAGKVIDSSAASVVAAVESGDVSVSDAASVADLPKTEQAEALKAVKKGEAKTLKAAAKPAKKKPAPKSAADDGPKQKSGKQKDDPRPFESWNSIFGQLKRKTSDLSKKHPADEFNRDMQAKLNEAYTIFENWKKAV